MSISSASLQFKSKGLWDEDDFAVGAAAPAPLSPDFFTKGKKFSDAASPAQKALQHSTVSSLHSFDAEFSELLWGSSKSHPGSAPLAPVDASGRRDGQGAAARQEDDSLPKPIQGSASVSVGLAVVHEDAREDLSQMPPTQGQGGDAKKGLGHHNINPLERQQQQEQQQQPQQQTGDHPALEKNVSSSEMGVGTHYDPQLGCRLGSMKADGAESMQVPEDKAPPLPPADEIMEVAAGYTPESWALAGKLWALLRERSQELLAPH